ncbi:MAG TPA: hypothetical protein VH458_22285 [Vicinamibacterales bacterium]
MTIVISTDLRRFTAVPDAPDFARQSCHISNVSSVSTMTDREGRV